MIGYKGVDLNKLLISVSGVRGIIGTALTADVAVNYAAAFGTFLPRGKVAVGGDTRKSGPMIKSAAIAGLLATGHDVIDIGICPTPTLELAVFDGSYAGAIAVTASHNPDQYNALKLIGPKGLFLNEIQGKKVKSIYAKGLQKNVKWDKVGNIYPDDSWINHHINKIFGLDIISLDSIASSHLKVVADCCGSTAAVVAANFFSRMDIDFHLVNSIPSDRFPRGPEPVPENLSDLCKTVKDQKANLGMAFDPDSDRLALVDENGIPLGEEYTLALAARFILQNKKGPMAVNLSSSLMNEFVAKNAGVKIYRTRVGERNVTEKLIKSKGVVGGEGNGGLIYPGLHFGRDAFLAAAVIIQYLTSSKKKISELARELPRYEMVKTTLNLSRSDVDKNVRKIEKLFPKARIDRLDGIKIIGDNWWVQIRASNTEPIARLMAEAPGKDDALKLISKVKRALSRR